MDHPPTEPTQPTSTLSAGRCHRCGYELQGLPDRGNCPECGGAYDPESAQRLRPWPGPAAVCARLGWPLLLLVFIGLAEAVSGGNGVATIVVGIPLLGVVAINSYFQVRSILKGSLPEHKRTRGPIAALRALGTALAVIVVLVTLVPFVVFAACLVVFNS